MIYRKKKEKKREHEKTSVFGNVLSKIIFVLFIHFCAAFARALTHAHARIILFNIKL